MLSRPARDSRAYRVATILLIGLLAVIVFANGWGVFSTDVKPEVYLAPGQMIHNYVSAWTSSPYLGGPNFNAGLAPVVLVVGALRGIGLSPEIAFKVFHLVLWVVAAWGAVRLVRRLDPRTGGLVSLVAGVAYIANPYAVSAGATLAVLLPMAWLPWQVLCLLRAFDEPRSWRWPALFGLTFFLSSGMNAGVVPVLALLVVIPVTLHARRRSHVSWGTAARVVGRCAVFVVWLSGYWLVSATAATGTGTQIVNSSESFTGIAEVSSFAEVIRGLGLWPLYGSDASGPWVPQHSAYLDNTVVVLGTFVAAGLALASLALVPRTIRRLLVSMIAMAAVVMVGLYPPDSPSLTGRALRWVFENVPVLSAFRTTNKIGAVLVLAFALSAALAVGEWVRRRRPQPVLAGLLGALVVVVTLPAWTGNLYISSLDVPDYWQEAGAALDAGDHDERVLALPGGVLAAYRWTAERPDDIFNSVTSRDVLVPVTTPNTSATAFNFTAALDDTFQSGTSAPDTTSTFARYAGAGEILLRNDVEWERDGGGRPSQSDALLSGDPGLSPVRNFGQPGENTRSPTVAPDGFFETYAPPLQLYRVKDARPMVRTESQGDSVVVAGDAWSVPAMARSGSLKGHPAFQYLQDLDDRALSSSLGKGHRLVVTDTNRRREAIANRLTSGEGPLLTAGEPLSGTSRTLGTSTDDQTVLRVEGGTVSATQSGFAFYDTPWGVPENAFDNDPRTSWLFGDFRRGAGQEITIRFDRPRTLGRIALRQAQLGPVRIDGVTVTAGTATRTTTLPKAGASTIDLGGIVADHLTVKVDDLKGKGYNAVGLSDVSIPGMKVTRVARVPTSLVRRYDAMSPAQRRAFAATPFDLSFTRVQGSAAAGDDEEMSLERDFSTVDTRRMRAGATVRVAGSREDLYDRLAGVPAGATSSGAYFANPDVRASRAFDGDRSTAWVPGGSVADSWIQQTAEPRTLPELTFDQRSLPGAGATSWVRSVDVVADGTTIASVDVKPGRNTIDLTKDGVAPKVRTIRLQVTKASGGTNASPPRIVEIGAGRKLVADTSASRCVTVATLDGAAVSMRPRTEASPDGSAWAMCHGRTTLTAGEHQLRSVDPAVTLDSLDLVDSARAAAVPSAPSLTVTRGVGARMTAHVAANPGGKPYFLSIGEGYDARWHATADGRDLGAPVVVDGYATGWLVSSTSAQTIKITFGPQRGTDIGIVLTLVGLAVVGAILLPGRAWRGIRTGLRRIPRPGLPSRVRRPSLRLAGRRRWGSLTGRVRMPARPTAAWRGAPHALRTALSWSLVAAGALVLASWPGLAAGVVLAVWHVARPPRPRTLVVAGATLVMASGAVLLLTLGDGRGVVAPSFVTGSPWPNVLAASGLVLALVGAWRLDTPDPDAEEDLSHA